jgi:DNA-binding beta-propeller fold protein YncE
MTRASSPADTIKNRKSINIISVIAITGILIGLIAAGVAIVFNLTQEKTPEALFAPLSTIMPELSTATTIPFASPVLTFGGQGTGAGLFSDARNIGVDSKGNIYVSDIETNLIQIFDTEGTYLRQWRTGKRDDGNDLNIQGMAVTLDGKVHIASSDAIYEFEGLTGERLGKLTYPEHGFFEDVAAAADGSILGVLFNFQENVVRFNKNGEIDLYMENPIGDVTDHSELNTTIAVDGVGNIYLLGSFNNMAFIYNRDGKYQNKFGGDGEGPGTFQAVGGIAVDNQSRIYVSDIHGIQIFDANGRYLDSFPISSGARAMTFDLEGNLYILTYQGIVTRFQINHRPD